MNSCEFVSFVTAVSCGIAKCVPKEDLPMIAAVFGQLAATLATITVQEEINSKENVTTEIVPDTEILKEPPIT
jgi:hypothetical protein